MVLATRLQYLLPKVIGDSHQGFVQGRQMSKLVMMMLAQMATDTSAKKITAKTSRVILLPDFRKDYDTVDREFLD